MLNTAIFTKKLQELMAYHELTASKFADSIGIQRSSISHLLSGRNKPSLDFVLKIIDRYPEVTFDWLVKGIGTLDGIETETPTLFDQQEKKLNPTIPQDRVTKKNSQNQQQKIEKVILLYQDGSFKEYDYKNE